MGQAAAPPKGSGSNGRRRVVLAQPVRVTKMMTCREPLQPALLTLTKVVTPDAALSTALLSYHVDFMAL